MKSELRAIGIFMNVHSHEEHNLQQLT